LGLSASAALGLGLSASAALGLGLSAGATLGLGLPGVSLVEHDYQVILAAGVDQKYVAQGATQGHAH
jgi:hypothetical protein